MNTSPHAHSFKIYYIYIYLKWYIILAFLYFMLISYIPLFLLRVFSFIWMEYFEINTSFLYYDCARNAIVFLVFRKLMIILFFFLYFYTFKCSNNHLGNVIFGGWCYQENILIYSEIYHKLLQLDPICRVLNNKQLTCFLSSSFPHLHVLS